MGLGLARLRKFAADENGMALILVSIMLPVIIGFALLVIDMSRAENLHNDTQKAADALALAAAAELDGSADAWIRSERALQNLVINNTRFSNGGTVSLPGDWTVTPANPAACRSSTNLEWCFLKELPANDSVSLDPTNGKGGDGKFYVATKASETRFILVAVKPETFSAIFPVSFISPGASGSFGVGAAAVAGFKRSVCDYTPMFICNPYGSMDDLAASLTGNKRAMFILKQQQGGNSQYGPGNYGFLKTPEGSGATPDITGMFASTGPKACYASDGVETSAGNVPPVNDGINIRFDIYPSGNKYDPATYPPAPIVTKGMAVKNAGKSNCSYEAPSSEQASNYMAMPKDTCLVSGGCSTPVSDRLGDGVWNIAKYWVINHPDVEFSTTGLPSDASRYEVYKWEYAHKNSHGSELTTPQCNTGIDDPKRRLINVAVIDCNTYSIKSNQHYPVEAFASFFLTEPAGSPPNADIYGEIIDITGRGGQGTLDNFLRDEAQLYR